MDGCIDDTDGDGVNDANDAFPQDASEFADTDGDGIGDVADFYPSDATRSVEEAKTSNLLLIVLTALVIGGIGAAVFYMRRSNGEVNQEESVDDYSKILPSEDIYSMASLEGNSLSEAKIVPPAHAITNEQGHTTWTDESGIYWFQDSDGNLKKWNGSEWQDHY